MKDNSMTRKFLSLAALGTAFIVCSANFASDTAAQDEHASEEKIMHVEKAPFGDAIAGKQKVATCVACHGADGNSTNADWPSLAGQHPEYLYEQLKLIKDGKRSAPLMVGQLDNKNDKDLKDISAYYAGLESVSGEAKADAFNHGQRLFRGGDAEKGIPSCAACHGANGAGNPLSGYPAIAGQQPAYTVKALNDYASGARKGNPQQKIMKEIAVNMSAEEMAAVASYIRGIQ